MVPRTDGFYRSSLIESVDWHAGVRMTEEYFQFLRFFPDGFYLSRIDESPDFAFLQLLSALEIEQLKYDYPQDYPTDQEGNHIYQMGRFEMADGCLQLINGTWIPYTNGSQWMERRRVLTVVSPELLTSQLADVSYEFVMG